MSDENHRPVLEPVGVAHTPYWTAGDAPHQGFATDDEATVEVFETYGDALAGIGDVVRLLVVYWADEADRDSLADEDGVGAFARRTPNRPNPLNVCTCTVLGVGDRRIRVRGLDAVDGSPVIDLKPALQSEL